MKAEKRHELQTNVVADWLGKNVQAIQPYLKGLTLVVALVAVIAVALWYNVGRRKAESGAASQAYITAVASRDPKALEQVSEDHAGTAAGLWAKVAAADIELSNGIDLMYTNREEAKETLSDAEKLYNAVEAGASAYPTLRNRARFGLAQTHESLGELDKAKKFYAQVKGQNHDPTLARVAARSYDRLAEPSSEGWYAEFLSHEPKPVGDIIPPPTGPAANLELPESFDRLSDVPDITLPPAETDPADESTPAAETALPEAGNTPATTTDPQETPATTSDDAASNDAASNDAAPDDAASDDAAPDDTAPGETTGTPAAEETPSAKGPDGAETPAATESPADDSEPSAPAPADADNSTPEKAN